MELERVQDIQISNVLSEHYDLAIFASGFEQRCVHLAHKISVSHLKKIAIFGFSESNSNQSRLANDTFFRSNFQQEIMMVEKTDDAGIYKFLNEWKFSIGEQKDVKILVDYSSMSRIWYTAIVNWITFQNQYNGIHIDFSYTIAEYKEEFSPLITENIIALPGYEGGTISQSKTVCIFGLGFDGPAALCAYDRIEPDIVHTFIASPAVFEAYPIKTLEANSVLIEQSGTKVIHLPLQSVENTFRYLGELVSTYVNNSNITFIPMGPKPHILACLLVSARFKEITCLHVNGIREKQMQRVMPTDNFAIVNLSFIKSLNSGN